MKSLPEKEFWKAISSRLDQYSEDPSADDWDRIRGALNAKPCKSIAVNRSSDVLVLIVLAFLMGFQVSRFYDRSEVASVSSASSTEALSGSKISGPALNRQHKTTSPDKTIVWSKDTVLQNHNLASTDQQVEAVQPQITKTQIHSNLSEFPKHNSAGTDESHSQNVTAQSNEAIASYTVHEGNSNNLHSEDDPDTKLQPRKIGDSTHAISTLNPNARNGSVVTNPTVSSEHNQTIALINATGSASVNESKVLKLDSAFILNPSKPDVQPQNPNAEEKKKTIRKFYPKVFLQINPLMGYNKIIPFKNDAIRIEKLNSPGILAGDRFTFSTEIGLQLPVARSLELYASVGYHTQQSFISYDYTSGEKLDVRGTKKPLSFEMTPMTQTRTYTVTMRQKLFSAGVLYHLKGTRLQHKIGGGMFYMIGDQSIRETDTFNTNTQSFGYQLHYRLEYLLTSRVGLYVQPQFRHSISSPKVPGLPFATKPYWAGIGFGLTFRF